MARSFMEKYDPTPPEPYGLIGFVLKNTLSAAGGMTYREDGAAVTEAIRRLTEDGTYSGDLFADLIF